MRTDTLSVPEIPRAFASDLVHLTACDPDRKMWMEIRKGGLSTALPVSTM